VYAGQSFLKGLYSNWPQDVMGLCTVNKKKFGLHHTDVSLFHSSQWSSEGSNHWGYAAYRVGLAVLMVAGITAHIIEFTGDNPGWKWLIYMTNQGITLLTLHYILYALIVVFNTLSHRGTTYSGDLPFFYKLSWVLQNMSSTVALFISLVYWIALHPYVVKYHMLGGAYAQFLNFFLHGFNSLSFLIDIFVTARPTRVHHFYFAIIFGLWYMTFSLVYWAAGGTGMCTTRCHSLNNTTTTTTTTAIMNTTMATTVANNCDEIVCDKFIYPILNWEDQPGPAVLMILIGVCMMPLIQTFWWVLHCCRKWICKMTGK